MREITSGDTLEQLAAAGVLPFLGEYHVDGKNVDGAVVDLDGLLAHLRKHPEFKEGIFAGKHRKKLGPKRCDFRSHTGSLGYGSLQVAVGCERRRVHADIDHHGSYTDVVGQLGHLYEVVRNRFNRWFGRG